MGTWRSTQRRGASSDPSLNRNINLGIPLIKQHHQMNQFAAPPIRPVNDAPKGWPASPGSVKRQTIFILLDVMVTMVLLAFAVAFLAFGLIVRKYDQVPTEQHPKITKSLLATSKYVRAFL